jgi:hypothetical protein
MIRLVASVVNGNQPRAPALGRYAAPESAAQPVQSSRFGPHKGLSLDSRQLRADQRAQPTRGTRARRSPTVFRAPSVRAGEPRRRFARNRRHVVESSMNMTISTVSRTARGLHVARASAGVIGCICCYAGRARAACYLSRLRSVRGPAM